MEKHVAIVEEVKCGFKVSENRKKLWNCELEMLTMLEKTCLENGIDYFLIYGSALGAARHSGFIPWDDDIDIGMLREDFEKFRECSKSKFPDYIDIQYGVSESGVDILMRIRDRRTAGIIRGERNRKNSKGIFIEIYVYDFTKNSIMGKVQVCMSRILCSIMCALNSDSKSISNSIKKILLRVVSIEKMWLLYEKVCKMYHNKKTDYVAPISLPKWAMIDGNINYDYVKKSKYIEFEKEKTRVPVENEKYLSLMFGDYMKLPPVEKRGTHHDNLVFYDPNKSYLDYEKSDIPDRYFAGDTNLELL